MKKLNKQRNAGVRSIIVSACSTVMLLSSVVFAAPETKEPVLALSLIERINPITNVVYCKTPPSPDLSTVLNNTVRAKLALVELGKALFWDMNVGSDGMQACASCHFNAGADSRSKNQMSPGLNQANGDTSPNPDTTFVNRPNYQLVSTDYPFHKLRDIKDRRTVVTTDPLLENDITGSQGVFKQRFVGVIPGSAEDLRINQTDTVFNVKGVNVRQVVPRNTPTVINAGFNHRNFWDGRAQNSFNGVNVFGNLDTAAHVYVSPDFATLTSTTVTFDDSSLASQAMAPPGSPMEMSAEGRELRHFGKKIAVMQPLAQQEVASDDSVLGRLSNHPGKGLRGIQYLNLMSEAFQFRWLFSSKLIQIDLASGAEKIVDKTSLPPAGSENFELYEYNFPLFFGLAVQAYENTLISCDTPFDRYNFGNKAALTADQIVGLDIFKNAGRCNNCHGGAELTDAATSIVNDKGRIRVRDSQLIDTGFNNIGVRPTLEDLGLGNQVKLRPNYAVDLSIARRALIGTCSPAELQAGDCDIPAGYNELSGAVAVDGAMKIPSLRNLELTAPYFHNGGVLSLEQLVDAYFRGGDFQPITGWDERRQTAHSISPLGTLTGPLFATTTDTLIPLTDSDKKKLVSLLKAGLTDNRVKYHRAPFDHPELKVPNGHRSEEDEDDEVTNDGTGKATDSLLTIPAAGRLGYSKPLSKFLNQ